MAPHGQGPFWHCAIRQLHLGELSRGPPPVDLLPGRLRRLLLRGRPPRPDHRDRPGGAAGQHARCRTEPPRHRARSRTLHPLRPEPRPRARAAHVVDREHRHHGRAATDDPVQGQGKGAGDGPGEPVHLSRAHGGRHPPLRRGGRARGRRSAPALGADPRCRPPFQPPLRRDVRRARGRDSRHGCARHGPPTSRPQDVEVGGLTARHHPPARLRRGHHAQGPQGGHRHRRGDALRPRGEARVGQPLGPAGRHDRTDAAGRRVGIRALRRSEERRRGVVVRGAAAGAGATVRARRGPALRRRGARTRRGARAGDRLGDVHPGRRGDRTPGARRDAKSRAR